MKRRYYYIFKGRVQGVGFRFTAIHYANNLGLNGWVKNEYDGTVSMEVEGEEYKIKKLIENLSSDSYIRIDSFTRKELPITNQQGFGLKGY